MNWRKAQEAVSRYSGSNSRGREVGSRFSFGKGQITHGAWNKECRRSSERPAWALTPVRSGQLEKYSKGGAKDKRRWTHCPMKRWGLVVLFLAVWVDYRLTNLVWFST